MDPNDNRDRNIRAPLRVTFRDGAVCDVNLSATFQVQPESAPHLIAAFGSYPSAVNRLTGLIEATAFAILERLRSDEVRQRRAKVQEEIYRSARQKAAEIHFTLHKVELRQITPVRKARPAGREGRGGHMHQRDQPDTVAVLTVIGPELQAMKHALGVKEGDRKPGGGHLWYEKGIANRFSGHVRAQLHVLGEAGNTSAAVDAATIIARGVRFLLLCGIAAGYRGKVKIGDVVVPRAVVDTSVKVAEGGKLKPRPSITGPLKGVLQMNAAAKVDGPGWRKLFKKLAKTALEPPTGLEKEYARHVAPTPSLHESAVLTDNLLLRDPQVLIDAANNLHQQVRAGEMEAGGFVHACMTAYPPVPWFVIRGISDFGDELKDDRFHAYAANAVASYAALYLARVLDLRIWEPGESLPREGTAKKEGRTPPRASDEEDPWYMAGTEGTGEYLVALQTRLGRVGYRLLGGSYRIRVEPSPAGNSLLARTLTKEGGWKQPGEGGQNRYSIVVQERHFGEKLQVATGALCQEGRDVLINPSAPDWVKGLIEQAGRSRPGA